VKPVELADLARWTPIRLTIERPEPVVDWCDFSGIRFEEPFFDQTVARWTGGEAPRPVIRTGLAELAALDDEPSLDPACFVFHMSRCGSTLLSRLLSTLPGLVVAGEPAPINSLLETDPDLVHDDARVAVLRLLIRAFGRVRSGDERHFVLKLSSWNIRLGRLFRRAFPEVPWLLVHRRPVEVMASILAGPPGWMQLRQHPRQAEYLFGLDPFEVSTMTPEEFCARVLASMLEAWLEQAGEDAMTIDYRDLPGAAWAKVAPFLKLAPSAADIARMAEEARFYAKDPAKRVFIGDGARATSLPEAAAELVLRVVDPVYARVVESAAMRR
jgi:hypothetical protein